MTQINKVVHRLRGKSADEKLNLARSAVSRLKGNIHFTGLVGNVDRLEGAADKLDSARTAAKCGNHELVGLKQIAERELMLEIASICSAVNSMAAGDLSKLITTGLPLRRENMPVGELPPPTGLVSRYLSSGGKRLAWKGHSGTKVYNISMSRTSEPFTWETFCSTTKQSIKLTSLEPGKTYWFAITAVGTSGESSMSAPFELMAVA